MDPEFWHGKWARAETGFHLGAPNPLLARHFGALGLRPGARVFVPLCGKTLDMHWLAERGHTVVGCELSPAAVNGFFEDRGITPHIEPQGALTRYSAGPIEIWLGDFFDLAPEALGTVDAVYDRAALVALPEALRARYARHVQALAPGAPQLVISYLYDQQVQPGPPFSVPDEEIARLYGAQHTPILMERVEIEGGLRGLCSAAEKIWLLRPRVHA